jgi:hypothetical protein
MKVPGMIENIFSYIVLGAGIKPKVMKSTKDSFLIFPRNFSGTKFSVEPKKSDLEFSE